LAGLSQDEIAAVLAKRRPPRISKEQKGLLVLDALMAERKTMDELVADTGLPHPAVRQGEEWLRDYDPNALVIQREGRRYFHKLAETVDEVTEHVSFRSRSLYRMAVRLERMVDNARSLWPEDRLLRVLHRHLSRMREDVEDLRSI
jgi:hypothetical protein